MNTKTHLEKYTYYYLILAMVCWGISWPTSKILTVYTDTFTLLFLKFFISAVSMIPVLFFLKEKRFFNIKIVKPLIYATIFIMIYNVFFFIGLKYGYSGLGGVLVTGSNPIFTFLIVAFLEKVKIPNIQKIALILGIIGTVITMDIIGLKASELLSGGNLLFLIASLMWSLVTIKSVEAKPYVNSLIFTLYLYISSSFVSFIFFVPVENIYAIFDYDYIFWINLIFTTAITSGFATTFYFVASNIIGASKASSFIFLVPVVALLSSAILMGEIPKLTTIIGGSILIIAVWLINKK